MKKEKLVNWLVLFVIFLLPIQTRWIFNELMLNGELWEYGKLSIYLSEIFLFIAVFLKGRTVPLTNAKRPIKFALLFVGFCFLGLSFAFNFTLSFGYLFHILAAYILFYILLDSRIKTQNIIFAFLAGLIFPSLLGWFQVIIGTSPGSTLLGLASKDVLVPGVSVVEASAGRLMRAYGTFSHPNIFGGFLAIALLLIFYLMSQVGKKMKIFLIALTIIFSSTLIITFSRSAWIALAIGLLIIVAKSLLQKIKIKKELFYLAGIMFFAALIPFVIFNQAFTTRFQPEARLEAKSIDERAGELNYVDDVLVMNPVTGVGIGGYTAALAKARPDDSIFSYQPVHNIFLLILSELGIVGLILFFVWTGSVVHKSDVFTSSDSVMQTSLFIAWFALGFFDHYLWSSWSGLALSVFVFALMLRLSKT